jgi:hypothetical protein
MRTITLRDWRFVLGRLIGKSIKRQCTNQGEQCRRDNEKPP